MVRRRGIYWFGTYGHRRRTVFTACMSWILTPSPTNPKPLRNVWRKLIARRRQSTSILILLSIRTSLPPSTQWTALSGSRLRLHLNTLQAALHKIDNRRTKVPSGRWRVGWQSLYSGTTNNASGGLGFWRPTSVWPAPCGKTARASTSSINTSIPHHPLQLISPPPLFFPLHFRQEDTSVQGAGSLAWDTPPFLPQHVPFPVPLGGYPSTPTPPSWTYIFYNLP